MGERLLCTQEVLGSNPCTSTIIPSFFDNRIVEEECRTHTSKLRSIRKKSTWEICKYLPCAPKHT